MNEKPAEAGLKIETKLGSNLLMLIYSAYLKRIERSMALTCLVSAPTEM